MALDLVAIVSVCISGVCSVIAQVQNSRCTKIEMCGSSCERAVAADDG